MISGSISPNSIDLTNELEIYKLIKRSKLLFSMCYTIAYMYPLIAFFTSISTLTLNYKFSYQLIVYGIPWSFILAFSVHYASNYLIWQMAYFYIICLYLKIKLKCLNNQIENRVKDKSKVGNNIVKNLLTSLNNIFHEIYDYNTNYWSTYLFWFVITFLIIINYGLFVIIFSQIEFLLRLSMIYAIFSSYILLTIVMNVASEISYKTSQTSKLLSSQFLVDCERSLKTSNRIKVFMKDSNLMSNSIII